MRFSIWHRKKIIVWAVIGVLVMVLFEAAQQYYYILQFSLADPNNVSFIEVLRGQFFRWVFWSVYAAALLWYVSKHPLEKDNIGRSEIIRYVAVLLAIILANIVSITVFQIFYTGEPFSMETFNEFFIFYAFQKSPIYLIAYAVLIAVAHYLMSTELLDVQLQQLSKLKETNLSLYQELKAKAYTDNTPVIQVKTGNRTKLVPVESIQWIEADDYCVKIHDSNGQSHTIRSAMKTLEHQLPTLEFLRVHRKAIVNINAVSEWQLGDEPMAILANGLQIPIAQSRLKQVKAQFQESSVLAKA